MRANWLILEWKQNYDGEYKIKERNFNTKQKENPCIGMKKHLDSRVKWLSS